MSKTLTGLIIGLILGAGLVFAFGFLYFQDQVESINEEYQTESKSIEDIFREQIDTINHLLDYSQSEYSQLETEHQNL
ncbi:MAG: hypothetical protein ACERKS_13500, partial [Candidatus Bathyarchaeota archaeon]